MLSVVFANVHLIFTIFSVYFHFHRKADEIVFIIESLLMNEFNNTCYVNTFISILIVSYRQAYLMKTTNENLVIFFSERIQTKLINVLKHYIIIALNGTYFNKSKNRLSKKNIFYEFSFR